MIFVTVGTHEQPFDRLIKCIDDLKCEGLINEEVIIQTGFSTYKPVHCIGCKLLPYNEMINKILEARIVITHGGPASFILPLQLGKIPIVVPRHKKFNEHVNNHQLEFCEKIENEYKNIIVIKDTNMLKSVIENYDMLIKNTESSIKGNNELFNINFSKIVEELLK